MLLGHLGAAVQVARAHLALFTDPAPLAGLQNPSLFVCQDALLTKRDEMTTVLDGNLAWHGRAEPGKAGLRDQEAAPVLQGQGLGGAGRAFGQTAWLPGVQVCVKK